MYQNSWSIYIYLTWKLIANYDPIFAWRFLILLYERIGVQIMKSGFIEVAFHFNTLKKVKIIAHKPIWNLAPFEIPFPTFPCYCCTGQQNEGIDELSCPIMWLIFTI